MCVENNPTVEALARRLQWTMERWDPSEDDGDWDKLTENQRDFYPACIRELLLDREILLSALN